MRGRGSLARVGCSQRVRGCPWPLGPVRRHSQVAIWLAPRRGRPKAEGGCRDLLLGTGLSVWHVALLPSHVGFKLPRGLVASDCARLRNIRYIFFIN